MARLSQRLLHILIALDQLAYVLLTLGHGYPDETLSSAAWRAERNGKVPGAIFRPVIDALFWAVTLGRERNHCENAYLAERERRQLPADLR